MKDLGNIERISKFYTSKKFQFVYADFFPFPENRLYRIIYTKSKSQIFVDFMHRKLYSLRNDTLFGKYKTAKRSLKREIYLTLSKVLVTKKIRNAGLMMRYFARSVLEREKIFEIDELKYDLDTPFYEKVKLMWLLKGSKELVKKINDSFLMDANKIMNGIRDSLDPLQFYKEELTPLEELQKRLGTITSDLTPPPSPPDDKRRSLPPGDRRPLPPGDRRPLPQGGGPPPSNGGGGPY